MKWTLDRGSITLGVDFEDLEPLPLLFLPHLFSSSLALLLVSGLSAISQQAATMLSLPIALSLSSGWPLYPS